MKNTVIWICGILLGALMGYGIGLLQSSSPYFWMGLGIILGSTVAVTYNIHREEDDDLIDDSDLQEATDAEPREKSQRSPNQQKVS